MENQPVSSSRDEGSHVSVGGLQQQVRSLQTLMVAVLMILILLSGSINIYLLRQVGYVRKDLETMRQQEPQLTQLIADYQKTSEPLIRNFVADLQNEARKYPELNPLLVKYNLSARPATGAAPATVTAPLPSSSGSTAPLTVPRN